MSEPLTAVIREGFAQVVVYRSNKQFAADTSVGLGQVNSRLDETSSRLNETIYRLAK